MAEEANVKRHMNMFRQTKPYDIFTWKIPNISSIPKTDDYVVQSPSFSFYDSSWILKMFPYGQKKEGSEGYIDVAIERLDQAKEESVFIQIFCEDVFGRRFFYGERVHTSAIGIRWFYHITQSLTDNPEKWRIAPNDTFTLVCALGGKESATFSESIQQNLGKRYRTSKYDENPEIGEIFKENSALKCFSGKLCNHNIKSVPAGHYISQQFSFANASWVLKIYPYFIMENSNKPSADVVLERLHSEISEHYFLLQIPGKEIEQSLFFNAHHTQGHAISIPIRAESKCLNFDLNIRMKRISEAESDYQTKSNKQPEGDNSILGSSVVLQNLKKLYLQQEDCDVVFNVKGKVFKAHRLILKAQSPVLASAFRINMKEKATGIFNVEDCEPSVFSDFLHFLYCGELEKVSNDNVFGLFTVADKYEVLNLRAMCMEFIKNNLSEDTFCDTIALALLHSEAELVKISTDFFAENLQEIIVTVKWQSFVVENPIQGNELMIKALVPSQRDIQS